jgi:hypothetical protein
VQWLDGQPAADRSRPRAPQPGRQRSQRLRPPCTPRKRLGLDVAGGTAGATHAQFLDVGQHAHGHMMPRRTGASMQCRESFNTGQVPEGVEFFSIVATRSRTR